MNAKVISSLSYSEIETKAHFKELLQTFPIKRFEKGACLIREGTKPHCIYFLEQGTVLSVADSKEITKEVVIDYFQRGDFINLSAFTNSNRNTQTIKAMSVTTCRCIPLFEFQALMRKNCYISQLMMHSLVRTLEKKDKRYFNNIYLDSKKRVVNFLIEQAQKKGIRVGYEWVIRKFFNQKEIAILTNTARQTVNTVLNELRRDNIIHFKYKYFIIRDLSKLKTRV